MIFKILGYRDMGVHTYTYIYVEAGTKDVRIWKRSDAGRRRQVKRGFFSSEKQQKIQAEWAGFSPKVYPCDVGSCGWQVALDQAKKHNLPDANPGWGALWLRKRGHTLHAWALAVQTRAEALGNCLNCPSLICNIWSVQIPILWFWCHQIDNSMIFKTIT